jgi:hypothetical protein
MDHLVVGNSLLAPEPWDITCQYSEALSLDAVREEDHVMRSVAQRIICNGKRTFSEFISVGLDAQGRHYEKAEQFCTRNTTGLSAFHPSSYPHGTRTARGSTRPINHDLNAFQYCRHGEAIMITRRVLLQAILATGLSGLCCHASSVLYDNTTTPVSGYAFLGATDVNGDLTTNIAINEVTVAAGTAGDQITSLEFQAVYSSNITGVFVSARPVWSFWAADGPGGDPGTLLAQFFSSRLVTFVATPACDCGGVVFDYNVSTPLLVPANGQIWVGLSFDNDYGASSITAAQLNNLGGVTFDPATVGKDSLEAFYVAPGAPLTDPTITQFAVGNQGNFGWSIVGSPAPATAPEPRTFGMMLLGVPAAAFVWRRRKKH